MTTMNMMEAPFAPKPGPFKTFLWKQLGGVSVETLLRCPQSDWSNVTAVAEINLLTFIYMTGLCAVICHRLYAAPGQIRPEFIILSAFLGAFLISIDSFMVNRAGYYQSGISELKRGGLDISGGLNARIRMGCFLAIRILLSVGIAQLSGIFLSLCIFAGDINSRAQTIYNEANAGLIATMAATVDAGIRQASDAVAKESAHYAGLASQVEAVRQNEIDPASRNPAVQQARQEIQQLLTRQSKADEDVRQAETFATNELGGVKGAGNSGHAGNGPRHRAAVEALANARKHAQDIEHALDAARARQERARGPLLSAGEETQTHAATQASAFEKALAAEQAKLADLQSRLDQLTRNRDATVHEMVENAPGHVSLNQGLLFQIAALEDIARNDNKITTLIILIDLTSFGFELAAVLVKITCYVPTTYSALLVRDVYLRNVRIADEMMQELNNGRSDEEDDPGVMDADALSDSEAQAPDGALQKVGFSEDGDPFGNVDIQAEAPRRGRGRPRKTPTPT